MQLIACGIVAMANTPESAVRQRDMHPDYMSESCREVMRAVDREMALRARLAEVDRESFDHRRYIILAPAKTGPGETFVEIEDARGKSVCTPSETIDGGMYRKIGPLYAAPVPAIPAMQSPELALLIREVMRANPGAKETHLSMVIAIAVSEAWRAAAPQPENKDYQSASID